MNNTADRSQGDQAPVDGVRSGSERPRRDWALLPLVSLLTICAMVSSTKRIADQLFRQSASTTLDCLVLNDPKTGVRGIPNTVCKQKSYESELIEYRFNGCGHRAGVECGPKPPGTYRIVMIGSSLTFGMHVPRDRSFAAVLPVELSQLTGRKVEVYNEGMQWGFPASAALRFDQALAAEPDLILWVLTPMDVSAASVILPYIPSEHPVETGGVTKGFDRVKAALATNSFKDAIVFAWDHAVVSAWNRRLDDFRGSPSGIMLQHVLYSSQSLYLKSSLSVPDSEGGFQKVKPSAAWRNNLHQFDKDATEIEAKAAAADVPFVAVLVPNRGQAAMLSMGEWPEGYDPYKLGQEVRDIIVRHGGIYIDILPDFRTIPDPEQHYFPVDGHPDANGHAMISNLLAKELTSGAIPALKVTTHPQTGFARAN